MSIVNFCLSTDRVAIVTDTLQYYDSEACGLTIGKAAHNDRYAIACRGRSWMSRLLQDNVQGDFRGDRQVSFEDTISILSELTISWAAPNDGMEAFLFGFSGERQRARAVKLEWRQPNVGATIREFENGVYMNPSVPLPAPGLPKFATDEQLYRVALAHYWAPRRHSIGYCVGGVCHLTAVDKAGAHQQIYGLFPDYDEMASKFSDPLAAAVAEWRNHSQQSMLA